MSEPRQPVIVGGARTPVGRLLGSLASKSASELGGVAIAAALDRAGLAPEHVEYVIMGQVLQAGAGQITARQAAVAAGIGMSVPALTVNKVCLSGLSAIALASQLVRLGEHDVVVAGGMESMTRAPHLLLNSRAGYKYGPVTVEDSMALDGLTDAFDHLSMGESTEDSGRHLGITREQQDEFAAMSHQRAAAAAKNGLFAAEIAAVPIPQRKGEPLLVTEDEGIRPGTTVEALARLKPAFGRDGTITAGTSSQISDGAAAVVVMSAEAAERAGLEVLAEIGAHGNVAGPDNSLHSQPSNAISQRPGQGRPDRLRPGHDRDQRGVRGGGHPVHARPGRRPGRGERQRRRDRHRPRHRGVRRPARGPPVLRAPPPRRRTRRGGPVRRRRPGRGPAVPGPRLAPSWLTSSHLSFLTVPVPGMLARLPG